MLRKWLDIEEECNLIGFKKRPRGLNVIDRCKNYKNTYRKRMLQNDIPLLMREFHKCHVVVKAAMDKAREDWTLKVANEAESALTNVQ